MKETIFYKALRYGYRLLKRVKHDLQNHTKPKTDRLLFTFGGRSEGWPGLGRSLYNTYPDFAASIKYYNTVLTENGGSEILSYFEEPVNNLYFNDESRFTCITAIQIAIVKHYNMLGFYPDAVMGISMGEPAAAFAAGALTAEETLKIAISYMSIFKEISMDYAYVFLNIGFNASKKFCEESKVWAEIIYEDSPNTVLIACHKNDINALQSALNEKQIGFKLRSNQLHIPYHTSLIKNYSKLLKSFYKDIEPKPLRCDYYSPTLGKLIPKYTVLHSDYWYELACSPVLFGRTLQAVLNDNYKTFLQIGPQGISERQFDNMVIHSEIDILNIFQENTDELKNYNDINKKLNKKIFERSLNTADNELTLLNEFKQHFNIHSVTTSPGYEYLRKNGPIHFIPHHNAWLILNYDDTDYVLKQPDVFSSSIFKDVDPILIGADPELHKVIRGLLQPLFSPAVIAELSSFTTTTARQILDKLCRQNTFDIVQDYSNSLSLFVLCNFFGLSSADADKMLDFTGIDYKSAEYWQRLEEYFNDQFSVCELTKNDSLWGKLRELVSNGQFVYTDAVSLLKIIWTAGIATTSGLISAGILIVLKNTELADQISTDEKQVAKFVEECLRLQTPVTAIHRITAQPVELAGQQLNAGEIVLMHLKSAMTDPAHFSNPEEFSITRAAKRHLAFGTGIHQCIGMGIARAEANSALNVVLKFLPKLRQYDFSEPEYLRSSEIQPMISLILTKKANSAVKASA